MTIEVRLGQPSDLDALKTVDCFYLAGHPERAEDIARWLRDGHAYLAADEKGPCAYAALGHCFGKPFIEMLMVGETHRRKGIGRVLLSYLENRVTAPDIWTSTNLSNRRMQSLLASLGYELTGFISNLEPGDPELFFFKKLTNQRPNKDAN